jgi:ABC-type lipoprotein export system ATPase subunit/ABC-type antimicrobial peptide transport system permease subunit
MIKIEKLSKDYKLGDGTDFFALKDVNIEIPKGIFVGVLGPSGSGKSTFMHLVGGMDKPSQGKIIIDSVDISNLSPNELSYFRKNKIGFVFQSFYLIESLTVLENVMVPAIFSGLSSSQAKKKAIGLLNKVNVKDRLDLRVSNLSGGQKQRVAIARALMNDPEIILADEPTGNLDSKNGEEVMDILGNLVKEGKTLIMVTHNKDLIKDSPFIISFIDGKVVNIEKKKITTPTKDNTESRKNKNIKTIELFKLAKNNIFQNKLRNLLTAIGISIGVAMLIILLSFGFGLKANLEKGLSSIISTNTITVSPSKNSGFSFSHVTAVSKGKLKILDLSTIKTLSKIKNVKEDWGQNTFFGNTSFKHTKGAIYIESLSPHQYINSSIYSSIAVGKIPQGDKGGILLQRTVAKEFSKNINSLVGKNIKISIGSGASVLSPTSLYTKAQTFSIKIVGITSGHLSYISYNQSILWSKLLENTKNPKFSNIEVLSNSTSNVKTIASIISSKGYGTQTLESVISELNTPFLIVDSILGIIGGISLVVSAIMILVIMLMEILERTREVGILKAVGAKRSDIRNLFILETIIIGSIGGIFGLVIGIIVIDILNYFINIFIKSSGGAATTLFSSPLYFYLLVFLFGIFIAVIAGIYPSSKASKMNPIDALRYE